MHWLQQSCIGSTHLLTAMSVVDPACVKAINNLLASKLPVNQMVDQVVHTLKKQGLAYHSVVTPSQVLCHPHNRANQMLSWLDMWDKGQKMMAIGMKRQFLGESMAIEIPPDPAKRFEQLMANENLIKEANGAMAPMTGSERSLVAMTAIRFMLFVSLKNHKQVAGIPCFHCFHLFMSMLRFPQLVHQPHHSFSEGHQPWLPAR